MENTERYSSDVAFTPAVKAVQTRLGSRGTYARQELGGSWTDRVTPELAEFIAEQNSLFLATASADGQPYIQHRGGPPGFLRVLDEHTLAFADFRGNRQYITVGNLSENPKAQLFLMDYAHRHRIKIWGKARVVEDQPELLASLLVAMTTTPALCAVLLRAHDARPEPRWLLLLKAWQSRAVHGVAAHFKAVVALLAGYLAIYFGLWGAAVAAVIPVTSSPRRAGSGWRTRSRLLPSAGRRALRTGPRARRGRTGSRPAPRRTARRCRWRRPL